MPVDTVATEGDVKTSETVASADDTVTAEGSKLAGRPANVDEPASSSNQPKPEAKKMPLSHHTAKAPTGKIDDAAKLKLEKAKEKLEDSVWLDPNDLNSRIPYKNINANGRLREISGKMSMFLRGHALADGRPSPEMDFTNLSMDWVELRHHLGNKIRNVVDWEILQVIRSTTIPGGSSCKCASPTMRKQPGRVCRGSRFVSELTKDTMPLCSRRANLLLYDP